MADTKQRNELLGTAEVIWDLTDLYAGTDDQYIESDIAWCETEAAAIRET